MATIVRPMTEARDDLARARLPIRLFRLALRLVFRLLFRVRVEGREHLPGVPCIYAVNHLGWTDPFLILLSFPVEPRIYVLGERQVMLISRWRAWLLTTLEIMVPLDRKEPRRAWEAMVRTIEHGGSLIIFPEGHLGHTEGTIAPLQSGAARLAVSTNVPIVPVGLTGTSELWLGRRLTLRVGAPLYPPAADEADAKTRTTTLTADLTTSLSALLPGDDPHPRIKLLRRWLTDLL